MEQQELDQLKGFASSIIRLVDEHMEMKEALGNKWYTNRTKMIEIEKLKERCHSLFSENYALKHELKKCQNITSDEDIMAQFKPVS